MLVQILKLLNSRPRYLYLSIFFLTGFYINFSFQWTPHNEYALGDTGNPMDGGDHFTSTAHTPELPQTEYKQKPIESAVSEFLIIQSAHPDTGSTLLTNILIGLFHRNHETANVMMVGDNKRLRKNLSYTVRSNGYVLKTHCLNLPFLRDAVSTVFGTVEGRVLFVRPQRCEVDPQCDESDVLCIPYGQLLYEDDAGREEVVRRVASVLKEKMSFLLQPRMLSALASDEAAAVARLKDMDAVTASLVSTNKSLKTFLKNANRKYGIHANHRGQSDTFRKEMKSHQENCDLGYKFLSDQK